ncbi:MAG: ABC transporter ATP-binding protein [Eubacteriales bacterium]|nr:ABC transporter ATP-binding protein [Eubacteriales bacterium]
MIEVKNLTKKYGSNTAVSDLSFTVEKGQIYGFLGPNGAGKSTTMNIMTGYIAPTSGQVLINGHDIVEDGQAARKCIGYLPEIPPVYPEMTVEEYLTFAAGLKKIQEKEMDRMIAEAMDMTGILEVKKRLIRNLSKGFRQRVGLAQAILGYPDIIILDEPMVGLDPKQIIEIRELIKELSKRHTVILSSHILSEVSAICDHIMIIAHGKLVASDTPENLTGLMKGSSSLELTLEGHKEEIRLAMREISRISEYMIKESVDENAVDIELRTKDGEDIRREIFFLCAQRRIPILRMQRTHVSLEDIFLELTEEDEAEKSDQEDKKKHLNLFRKKEKNAAVLADRVKEGKNNDSSL